MNNYPDNNQNENLQETFTAVGTETAPIKPKKNRKKLIVIIAVIVLLIGVCVFLFATKFTNSIMKLAPAEKHFEYVVKSNVDDITAPIFSLMDNSNSKKAEESLPVALEGNVKAEISGSAKDLILSAIKEQNPELFENVNINDIDIGFVSILDNGSASVDLKISANGKELLSPELRLDIENGIFSLLISELSSKALSANFGTIELDPEISDGLDTLLNASITLPDSKTTKKVVTKYIEIILDQFDEIKRTNGNIEIDGVSQKTSRFDITLNEELLYEMLTAVLTEAEEDENIEILINEYYDVLPEDVRKQIFGNVSADDICDGFYEAVSDELDNIEDIDNFSDEEVNISVWVNNSGRIIAIEISDPDDNFEIFFGVATSSKEIGYEFKVSDRSTEFVRIVGNGKKDGEGLAGYVDFKIDGTEYLTLEYENAVANDKKLSGTFTLSAGAGLKGLISQSEPGLDIGKYKIVLTLDCVADTSAAISLALTENGSDMIKLSVNSTVLKDIPELSEHSDSTSDPNEWSSSFEESKITDLLNNISSAFGLTITQ